MRMQHRGVLCCALLAAAGLCWANGVASAQTINKYDVNFTEDPPTIDGVVSPGEWDDADAAQGGWHVLRDIASVDNQNSRWQAVWDDDAMYILFQSDYGNWSPGPSTGSMDFGSDNLNLYFDPNVDGEPNILEGVGPDGYQIAFNQFMGASSIEEGAVLNNTGIYTEAHKDLPFGNQAGWEGLLETTMSQNMSAGGGVTEMRITWVDFDADNPDDPNNVNPQGLYHNFAPEADDTWYFKISRITYPGGNLYLPDWNPTQEQSFTFRPHGEITFVVPGGGQLGDTNGDGLVDIVDLNNVRNNFGGAGVGDTNDDGTIDIVDLNNVRNNFGAGGNPVPEPHAIGLLVVGAAAGLGYRRVRRPIR